MAAKTGGVLGPPLVAHVVQSKEDPSHPSFVGCWLIGLYPGWLHMRSCW